MTNGLAQNRASINQRIRFSRTDQVEQFSSGQFAALVGGFKQAIGEVAFGGVQFQDSFFDRAA